MLLPSRPLNTSSLPRSVNEIASLCCSGSSRDLSRDTQRAKAEISASKEVNPSILMPGSPPPPITDPRERLGLDQASSNYTATSIQDAYRDRTATQRPVELRLQLPSPGQLPGRPYQHHSDPSPMVHPYGYRSSVDSTSQTPLQSPLDSHSHTSGPGQYPYASGSAAASSASQSSAPSAASTAEPQPMGSPKSQRKAKGHVASACVPCKRAHLRCDSQRPCSRCISNGKEDSCVDVQHKKRGRPRLRDDRDARFDSLMPSHSQDGSPRRPLNIYPSAGTGPSGFDDHYQRRHSFRSSEGRVGSAFPYKQPERESSMDSNSYSTTFSNTPPGNLEPVAYLTLGFEFIKASGPFLDAIGIGSAAARKLIDVIPPAEVEKVSKLAEHMNHEQRRREPNYLPPILGNGSQSIQNLGFTADDFGRFPLDVHDHLSFVAANGYSRPQAFRAGLAKESSFYFVVFLLVNVQHQIRPAPLPHLPTPQSTVPYKRSSPEATFPQRMSFDPIRHRSSENRPQQNMPLEPQNTQGYHSILNNLTSSLGGRLYDPNPERQAYGAPSYPTPTGVTAGSTTPILPRNFQLPPIRAEPDRRQSTDSVTWPRTDRSNRLNIQGLIDDPEELTREGKR